MALSAPEFALVNAIIGPTSPRDLLRVEENGQRRFKNLYDEAFKAGLPLQPATEDEDKLHALFTYMADNDVGTFVQDYVRIVCLDSSLTR